MYVYWRSYKIQVYLSELLTCKVLTRKMINNNNNKPAEQKYIFTRPTRFTKTEHEHKINQNLHKKKKKKKNRYLHNYHISQKYFKS